jgi:hypothetical protein
MAKINIFFGPDKPTASNKVHQLCQDLPIRRVPSIVDAHIAWAWDISPTDLRHELVGDSFINGRMKTIKKSEVAKLNDQIGYLGDGLTINPETYRGKFIRKSEAQYKHDGIIMDGPRDLEEIHDDKYTFQKYIDCRDLQGRHIEYRFILIRRPGSAFPAYLIIKRAKVLPFKYNPQDRITIMKRDFLPHKILVSVLAAADRIGMDVGEMDLLHDDRTDQWYIVDINQCPGNGIYQAPGTAGRLVRAFYAAAFDRHFIKPLIKSK